MRLPRGILHVLIHLKRNDELGELVDAYNGMATSLREKETVQEALAKYTSKDLVNQMLEDKSRLELGGAKSSCHHIFFRCQRIKCAFLSVGCC